MENHFQQLGNYRFIRPLGQGSFAWAYLGEHISLKKRMAVKVLRAPLSREDQERFLVEMQTIGHLKHPNILPVSEYGVLEGIPFLVMPYVSGGSLRQQHRRGVCLPPLTILPSIRQIAAALQSAHNQGIIHRNLKPENLLLDLNDTVFLSDFGLTIGQQSSRSQSMEEVANAARYMAPEQLLGKPRFASDQYALAIIVYEWLTGARPFQGSYVEVSSQHIFTPPPPLREKAPDVPPAIEAVVMKALSKDPEQRFATIQEFANALEAATAPVPAHAEHSPMPLPPTTRRITPVRLTVALATLVLLILGTVAYPLLALHFLTPPAPPSKEQLLYQQATSGTPAIADSLRTNSPLLWTNDHYDPCLFTDGALHVSDNSEADSCYLTYVSVNNFALQIQVTIIEGNAASLEFRETIGSNYYSFSIYSAGQCDLLLTNLSSMSERSLFNPQNCAGIRPGANQTNLLTVIARKSDIYLYINKQFVAHVVDNSAASGSISVDGFSDLPAVDVAFSDLQIWNL